MPDMMEELYDVTVEALETTDKDRKSRERDSAQEMVPREKSRFSSREREGEEKSEDSGRANI